MRKITRALALLGLTAAACGDSSSTPVAALVRDPPSQDQPAKSADAGWFIAGGDESTSLDAVGAVPAWTAVVDRARLLARRQQRGAVYGRVGSAAGDLHWLIDETEGEDSLGIRLDPGPGVELEPGQRVVARGAWTVDREHHWVWSADALHVLADEPGAAATPGHVPRAKAIAEGAIDIAETEGDGVILFMVVRAPINLGDGWLVASRSADEALALLLLPGEHEPYGGQDMLSSEERWGLSRGVRYAVTIGKVRRPRRGDGLPVMRALSAPVEVARN